MSGDEAAAIRELTGEVGELRGSFQGLKDFIEMQTSACKTNYENLNDGFINVSKKINGIVTEDKIKGRFWKIFERGLTLICVVVMAYIAFDMQKSKRANKNTEPVYASANASIENESLAKRIRGLENRLKGISPPTKQPEE